MAQSVSARIFVGVATLLLAIGLGAWFSIDASRNSAPRSFRFLIPEGYRGWVRVEFEIPGAPPLPTEAGQTVIKIPPSGLLRTSSPEQYGWARGMTTFSTPSDRSAAHPRFRRRPDSSGARSTIP